MAKILVVDDELGIRDLLFEILNDEGHIVELAENAAQARAVRLRSTPDLVLLDIWMPDTDGVTLLKEWRGAGLLTMPVVMMSGHATIETAVEATRIGALSFLEKPITLQKLLKAVGTALARGAEIQRTHAVEPVSQTVSPAANPSSSPQQRQMFDLDVPLRDARDSFEKAYFEFHLAKEDGSMTRVAEKTGLERTHLYRKLKQLGIDLGRRKTPPLPSGVSAGAGASQTMGRASDTVHSVGSSTLSPSGISSSQKEGASSKTLTQRLFNS